MKANPHRLAFFLAIRGVVTGTGFYTSKLQG
jgi:hypothetical protein